MAKPTACGTGAEASPHVQFLRNALPPLDLSFILRGSGEIERKVHTQSRLLRASRGLGEADSHLRADGRIAGDNRSLNTSVRVPGGLASTGIRQLPFPCGLSICGGHLRALVLALREPLFNLWPARRRALPSHVGASPRALKPSSDRSHDFAPQRLTQLMHIFVVYGNHLQMQPRHFIG